MEFNVKKYLVLIGLFVFTQNNLLAGQLFSSRANIGKCNSNELGFKLVEAVKNNNISEVKKLIQAGANVNAKYDNSDTVLIEATRNGNIEIVRLLLKYGADVNIQNKYGNTALTYASGSGHIDIVRLLLEHGANVNTKSKYNLTPLIMATRNGHTEIVKLLLEHGSDVNAIDNCGDTALIEASYRGYIEIEELLKSVIEAEKDINKFKDQSKELFEVKDLLINRWINLYIKNKNPELLQRLIQLASREKLEAKIKYMIKVLQPSLNIKRSRSKMIKDTETEIILRNVLANIKNKMNMPK